MIHRSKGLECQAQRTRCNEVNYTLSLKQSDGVCVAIIQGGQRPSQESWCKFKQVLLGDTKEYKIRSVPDTLEKADAGSSDTLAWDYRGSWSAPHCYSRLEPLVEVNNIRQLIGKQLNLVTQYSFKDVSTGFYIWIALTSMWFAMPIH